MDPLLSIRGLNVEFQTPRGRLHVLRDINIDVPRGKILGVVGESGSGKSTVGKCFEDLGYYCLDNLPLTLLRELLSSPEEHLDDKDRVCVVTDVRATGLARELPELLADVDQNKLLHVKVCIIIGARQHSYNRFRIG